VEGEGGGDQSCNKRERERERERKLQNARARGNALFLSVYFMRRPILQQNKIKMRRHGEMHFFFLFILFFFLGD